MTEHLSIAISTCPNDTFAFHGLLERKVDPHGLEFHFQLHDVETLNQHLTGRDLHAVKVSFAAAIDHAEDYCVLPVGSALGFGVGPIVLARNHAPRGPNGTLQGRVLAPGAHTTAALLLRLFHPNEGSIEQCVFSEIIPALERGDADYGVCIHEGRFTWQGRGLEWIEDLGVRWETAVGLPLPLGGIVAQKSLGEERLRRLTLAIRASIDYGFEHREEALLTMRRYAPGQVDDALWKHVELYVNADTLALSAEGQRAIEEIGRRSELSPFEGDGREAAGGFSTSKLQVLTVPDLQRIFRIERMPLELGAKATQPDGFVHLSFAGQIAATLQRHYADAAELALLEISRDRVVDALRIEPSRGGADFPHVYRPLGAEDVLRQWQLEKSGDGFTLPQLASGAEFDQPRGNPVTLQGR